MTELKKECINQNYKIVDRINADINVIEIETEKYLLKKMTVPMTEDEMASQHRYINYLKENGVKTAAILSKYQSGNDTYEIQEYIGKGNDVISPEELFESIAKYHYISSKYSESFLKEKTYDYIFECRGAKLNKLLLGFDEKYYAYPMINFQRNRLLIAEENSAYVEDILTKYIECYNYFVANYSKDNCIIHNDITSNNVLKLNNEVYLIDFDLAIQSTVYVDFVDSIIKRYKQVSDIDFDKLRNDIRQYIEIYNDINNCTQVDMKGTLCLTLLKLVSFNFYVLLTEEKKDVFNQNIKDLHTAIKAIYSMFKEVKNDKKSKTRRRQ